MGDKMATKVVTFRLPEELIQAITSQAKATGRCNTAVVVDALKQVFGFPTSTTPSASLEGLHKKQEELREKAVCLSQQLVELKQEMSSEGNARALEGVNQSIAAGQALLAQVSLPLS